MAGDARTDRFCLGLRRKPPFCTTSAAPLARRCFAWIGQAGMPLTQSGRRRTTPPPPVHLVLLARGTVTRFKSLKARPCVRCLIPSIRYLSLSVSNALALLTLLAASLSFRSPS